MQPLLSRCSIWPAVEPGASLSFMQSKVPVEWGVFPALLCTAPVQERWPGRKPSCAVAVLCDVKDGAATALLCTQRVTGMGKACFQV